MRKSEPAHGAPRTTLAVRTHTKYGTKRSGACQDEAACSIAHACPAAPAYPDRLRHAAHAGGSDA